jgi:mono/diheme cytochrome c family protein
VLTLVAACFVGCGANAGDLLFNSLSATGNTALDLLLTQFANQVADALNPPPDNGNANDNASDNTNDNVAENENENTNVNDNSSGELPDGDPVAGQAAFIANACNTCHGDAGQGGGIGPALANENKLAGLEQRFGDGAAHFGHTLSAQDIQDVATWLLDPSATDGGGGGDGDAAAGETFFGANCASCHGADGSSGFAPDIPGFSADDIAAGLESGVHASITATDADIADMAAYLATQ